MPSSSSLVQEKGRPEMKSLCFSRVVLYLNTYKKGKGHGWMEQPRLSHTWSRDSRDKITWAHHLCK